jgi:hypothetical protein
MAPLRTEYKHFLDNAKERRTVSMFDFRADDWAAACRRPLIHFRRKPPVKIPSEPLQMP